MSPAVRSPGAAHQPRLEDGHLAGPGQKASGRTPACQNRDGGCAPPMGSAAHRVLRSSAPPSAPRPAPRVYNRSGRSLRELRCPQTSPLGDKRNVIGGRNQERIRVPHAHRAIVHGKVVRIAGVSRGTSAGMEYALSGASVTCSRQRQTWRNRGTQRRGSRSDGMAGQPKESGSVTGSFHQFSPRRAPMIPSRTVGHATSLRQPADWRRSLS